METKKNPKIGIIILCIIIYLVYSFISSGVESLKESGININLFENDSKLRIIATDEAKGVCELIEKYAKSKNYDISVEYAGSIEIIDKLNQGEKFDSVLLSNSIWTAMLDTVKLSDYDTVSIDPVVFGVRKSKAKELGLIKENLMLEDIVKVISDGSLKFTMPSGTQTNTGASSLLGFTYTLCGSPEVLTIEDVKKEELSAKLSSLFAGVNKSSGSESFVEELYLTGKYDAAVLYETSVININKNIKNEDDMIYALYPVDGVSISDLLFGYIDNKNENKKEMYEDLKKYILSNAAQNELLNKGYRVWYGGIKEDVDKSVFNKDWGIDTTKYITPIKYPSIDVIKEIFSLYQSELRKPTHTVFALDFSGSMYGDGYKELCTAMEYILDETKASKDYIQFSNKDVVTVIPFSTYVIDVYSTLNGTSYKEMIEKIKETEVYGGTNIYDSVTRALNVLKDVNTDEYNLAIVIMTDGEGNSGSEKNMISTYNSINKDIPVYSILFGDASERDMQKIANLTGGKVFDGKKNLSYAFKQVRGYN
ncbi:MAG: VWA domain-containing protein [Clostridia bacterium]|nr:VWA domain-containing protein [Clostridia bacterium]